MIKEVNIKLNSNNVAMSELIAVADNFYIKINSSNYGLLDNYLSEYTSGTKTLLRVIQQIFCFEEDIYKITEDQIHVEEIHDATNFIALYYNDPDPIKYDARDDKYISTNEIFITDTNDIEHRIEYIADKLIWISGCNAESITINGVKYIKLQDDVTVTHPEYINTYTGSLYVLATDGIYLESDFFVLNNEAFRFNSKKDWISIDNILDKVNKYHNILKKCKLLDQKVIKQCFSDGMLIVELNNELVAI